MDRVYDPETVAMIGRAIESAWIELVRREGARLQAQRAGVRNAIALRMLAAVDLGQQDPHRLHLLALDVIAPEAVAAYRRNTGSGSHASRSRRCPSEGVQT
jgi:hypothetical protein